MNFDQFKKPEDKAKTDTKNWYSDRYQTVIVQRNILFIAVLVSLGVTLITTFLIYMHVPLVTVEPFAIEVDRRSGIVQTVQPMTFDSNTKDQKVSNYLIVSWMRAHETAGISDFGYNLNFVRISSDPNIFNEFLRDKNPFDKNSEIGKLGQGAKRDIAIKSMYFLRPDHVQIRYVITDRNGEGTSTAHYLANLKFEFREIKLNLDEVFLNPLGFYVTSFDTNKEAQ